jgi:hypothetical protein
MSTNCVFHPLTCLQSGATGVASGAATSAWDGVCQSFASAAASLFKAFGTAFAALPTINLDAAGISSTYGACLAIAATVSALMVFGQVIRTAWTHDGSGISEAVSGVAKTVVTWLLTAAVATAALGASDGITRVIVAQSFGSQQALADRLGTIVNWAGVTGDPGQVILGGSLLLVFALAGILLVIVLWAELLLRNAAIAVLIAMSPIAAAGQASEATKAWWTRTASATAQLIILKPVIALVFAVGFGMAGTSGGVEQVLEGLLILGLAAFSWPVVARFFTFASIQSSSSGLATALGFLAGAASQSGGGTTAGLSPEQWSMAAESRTMAGRTGAGGQPAGGMPASGAGPAALPGAASTGGASGAGATGGAAGGGNGAAVLAGIGFALQKAQQAGAAASARMEQTAAHAGMHGAYPYSTVSGGQRQGPATQRPYQEADATAPYAAEALPGTAESAPSPVAQDPLVGRDPSVTLALDAPPRPEDESR